MGKLTAKWLYRCYSKRLKHACQPSLCHHRSRSTTLCLARLVRLRRWKERNLILLPAISTRWTRQQGLSILPPKRLSPLLDMFRKRTTRRFIKYQSTYNRLSCKDMGLPLHWQVIALEQLLKVSKPTSYLKHQHSFNSFSSSPNNSSRSVWSKYSIPKTIIIRTIRLTRLSDWLISSRSKHF